MGVCVAMCFADEAERNFVSKCLKSLELSGAPGKNTFAIVDYKAEHADGIYPSWQRKMRENGMEFTVSAVSFKLNSGVCSNADPQAFSLS